MIPIGVLTCVTLWLTFLFLIWWWINIYLSSLVICFALICIQNCNPNLTTSCFRLFVPLLISILVHEMYGCVYSFFPFSTCLYYLYLKEKHSLPVLGWVTCDTAIFVRSNSKFITFSYSHIHTYRNKCCSKSSWTAWETIVVSKSTHNLHKPLCSFFSILSPSLSHNVYPII